QALLSRLRHRSNALPAGDFARGYREAIAQGTWAAEYYPTRVRPSLACRVVYRAMGKRPPTQRTQRRQPRAVASERRRPSMGECLFAYALLALFRDRRKQDQQTRARLVSVDDS